MKRLNITIFNEFLHELEEGEPKRHYPNGIHAVLGDFLKKNLDANITYATLNQPEHGLTDEVLKKTDVMLWWGHMGHNLVRDDIAEKVRDRVLSGMGLIVLHSGHLSKPFRLLMGTTCSLKWRERPNENLRLWQVNPAHPIAQGVPEYVDVENDEMYGEPFGIPEPDELVFIGWFKGGNVFRSGCCFQRDYGRIFYFQPGHESFPVYYNPHIQRIITNAVVWASPRILLDEPPSCPWTPEIEKLD